MSAVEAGKQAEPHPERRHLHRHNQEMQVCTRCIYDNINVPTISFDENGVCIYCHMIDRLQDEYKTGTPDGDREFEKIVEEIKAAGKGKKYDCIAGVSGGTDSSYLMHVAVKKYGLRPLAVHLDNTWNTAIATENIRKVLDPLGVDLHTHVVNNKEMDDIYRSFFKASVPDLDAASDIGVPQLLYSVAAKHGVRYLLEGHSFRAEGVSPLGMMYADGKYIESVQKKFGTYKIETFPNMSLLSFLKWITLYRIKKVRPLWYIRYSKEEAREFLQKEYGWQYYGGHHLENRMTSFHHSYLLPRKFGVDSRNNSLSASVRSGLMSRDDALVEFATEPYLEPELLDYWKKRLGFSDEEFERIMNLPPKSRKDFKTYKESFERLRPFFWLLLQFDLIPVSFYIKYTAKSGLKF